MKKKPKMKGLGGGSSFLVSFFDTDTMYRPATGHGSSPESAWREFQEDQRIAKRTNKKAANDDEYLDCAYGAC